MLPGGIGLPELLLISFLAILFFGKDKLPDLAKGMGNSIKEFKNALGTSTNEITEISESVKNPTKKSAVKIVKKIAKTK